MDFNIVLENYKKRKLHSVGGVGNSDPRKSKSNSLVNLSGVVGSRAVGIYFICNEGSVTHYYHFLFAALIPMIEYHLKSQTIGYRIKTDIGPMKSILCAMPFNIEEICGPMVDSLDFNKDHDDKSAYSNLRVERGETILPAYDSFNNEFYGDETVPKLTLSSKSSIVSFIKSYVPFYIFSMPAKKIVLIERQVDSYYKQLNISNRAEIYSTSGSQRR